MSKDKKKFLYDSAGFNCSLLYKKKCNNKTYIREKDLNEIVKNEVIKRLSLIQVDETTNKIIDYYKNNNEEIQKIKNYENEIERLERRKSVLYKKKCEKYITVEEFKTDYERAKEEIAKYKNLIEELKKDNRNKLDENKIREVVKKFKDGNYMSNDFLKDIINRIDVYSKNRIEIIFNL